MLRDSGRSSSTPRLLGSILPPHRTRSGWGRSFLEAKSIVVATGMNHRKLGVPGEDRLMGRGVFACATCDAALCWIEKVTVVGGGDSAVQGGNRPRTVRLRGQLIIHRRDETRACRYLMDAAEANPKIKFLYSTQHGHRDVGTDPSNRCRLSDLNAGESRLAETDGVLVCDGLGIPNTAMFRGQRRWRWTEKGYLKTGMGVKTSNSPASTPQATS